MEEEHGVEGGVEAQVECGEEDAKNRKMQQKNAAKWVKTKRDKIESQIKKKVLLKTKRARV